MLGLLVFPSQLLAVRGSADPRPRRSRSSRDPWWSRCASLPLRFPGTRSLYVGWVGLRGAVPIILAMFPVLAGAPGATRIFNIVFFIVVLNAILPGTTVPWVTRRLSSNRPSRRRRTPS